MVNNIEIERLIEELILEKESRVYEFSFFKRLINEASLEKKELICKICMPIIYAHWEGFCVFSLRLLIDFLNTQSLNICNVSFELFTLHKNKTYNYLKGKHSFDQRCKFTESFISDLGKEIKIKYDVINTKSNLNFNNLIELLQKFGITTEEFKKYEGDLNKIVNIRNSIAHGQNSIVLAKNDENDLKDDISDFIKIITALFDELILAINNYLNEIKFMR